MDIFSLFRLCSLSESFSEEKGVKPEPIAVDSKLKSLALKIPKKGGALFPSAIAPQIGAQFLSALEETEKFSGRRVAKRRKRKIERRRFEADKKEARCFQRALALLKEEDSSLSL